MAYEPFVGFGTRKGIVYELDATYGLPKATSTSPYVGVEIYGIRGLQLTQTNVRRIAHYDGDRVGLTQILPTLDVPSGTITVDGADLTLGSILGSVTKTTVSGMELMPMMSDQQGDEPNVGLIVYQAARKTTGVTGWHFHIVPTTQLVAQPGSFGDNNYETVYQMSPSASLKHLWGLAFSTSTDGTESSALIEGFAPYKPRVTAWLADGTEDVFAFDAALNATDTSYKLYQAIAGVVSEVTVGVTKAVDDITFATGSIPANNTILLAAHMVA